MARKGQFKKGGGRVGGARKARRSSPSKAVTKYRTNTVTKYRTRSAPKRHRRSHRKGGGGGMSPLMMGVLALGAAYATGPKGPEMVRSTLNKVPGSSTFGPLAVLGAGGLAYDRFVKRNKYAKALGIIGVIGAAMKIGEAGADFKWVGDDDFTGDISDVGDDDIGDDDVGDDDVGDDDY